LPRWRRVVRASALEEEIHERLSLLPPIRMTPPDTSVGREVALNNVPVRSLAEPRGRIASIVRPRFAAKAK
jgi:hypothetical protein